MAYRWFLLTKTHYEEMSCNDSFRSKILHYCQESKISLQKRTKSLIFYSEQFLGHHFSAKSGSHIFWDKWNVEADSESLLKNLKLLPYSILMPDHSIKLYFTGSKDIQIWEYLRAHICSQKILLTPNWIRKKWLVWHKFFEIHIWECHSLQKVQISSNVLIEYTSYRKIGLFVWPF